MGLFDDLGKGIKSFAGGLADSFIPGVGSSLAGMASDKVAGIPTPKDYDPKVSGTNARSFMDEAYPGTTPWERLGVSNSGSATEVQRDQSKNQARMQDKELANSRSITNSNNRASVIASTAGLGPQAMDTALGRLATTPLGARGAHDDYETANKLGRDRLDAEKPGIEGRGKFHEFTGKLADKVSQGYSQLNKISGYPFRVAGRAYASLEDASNRYPFNRRRRG